MKKKTKKNLQFILVISICLIAMGIFNGWFLPAKPSVILHIAPNLTEIMGFAFAKYPGSMACAACMGFYGQVKVYYQEKLICQSEESTINLGEVILPIRCTNELTKYENQSVRIEAIGRVNSIGSNEIETPSSKEMNLTFVNKR